MQNNAKPGFIHASRLLFILGLLLVLFSIFHTFKIYEPNKPIHLDTAVATEDGWYSAEGDDRVPVSLSNSFPAKDGSFTIYRECSREELSRGLMLIDNQRQQLRVFLDDQMIFSFDSEDYNTLISINGFIPVRLDHIQDDGVISITYSACRDNMCNIGEVFFCTPSEGFVHILSMDIFAAVFLIITILLTIITGCISLHLIVNRMPNMRIISLFCILLIACVWIFTNMWLITFVPLSRYVISQLCYTALMLLPIPICGFAYYSISNCSDLYLKHISLLAIINVIAQQLLYYKGGYTFYDMLPLTQVILGIACVATVIAIIVNHLKNRTSESFILLLTFVIPLVMLMVTVLLFWLTEGREYLLVVLALLVFFIIMLSVNALHSQLSNTYKIRVAENELQIYQTLSVKDGLTGLGNRRSFDDNINTIERGASEDSILIFLDLNKLKFINDSFGHEVGDKMIKDGARCISAAYSSFGNVYRIGGDEFAVLIENPTLSDSEYFDILDREIKQYNKSSSIELSIAKGLCHHRNDSGQRREISLWKSTADREMYADKMRSKIADGDITRYDIISDDIDPLSGILTLEGFRKNAMHLILRNPSLDYSMCYLDIKNFKLVNDFYGYETGDALIKYLAMEILDDLSPNETCGRLSADNMVVLSAISDYDKLEKKVSILTGKICRFFDDYNTIYRGELAAGFYTLTDEDKKSPNINQMLDRANIAQKTVKYTAGKTIARFDEEMWNSQMRELYISQSFDDALANGDITVWFQPQYNYATGKISGAEALCRWNHKSLGWLSPGEFLPVLERTGVITKLDYYVWEETCRLVSRWHSMDCYQTIPVSVNISRMDIADRNLADTFNELLRRYNLPPSAIHLEITENAYINQPAMLMKAIEDLHAYGFTVEMDDFGSGYSSLSMLKHLPVDLLKIDMGFLKGDSQIEKGSQIVGSVIHMARNLGIAVLTEGVETEAQAEHISNMGCSLMQGFYFSKPLPVSEFEQLLMEERLKNAPMAIDVSDLSDDSAQVISDISDIALNNSKISEVFMSEYYVDTEQRIMQLDDMFTALTGYSTKDVKEKSLSQNDLIPEEDREIYWKIVDVQSLAHQEVHLKHNLLRKDGQVITVFCSGLPIIDEHTGENRTRIRIRASRNDVETDGDTSI
ncbi:MAG: EAL domain-containing protein [Eubacteriaceae bacterium]|nr:EAL domain-containing protein [Eubacteriaceae bacterium]